MKLASLKNGRDGKLAIVSRDLAKAVFADGIAPTMQSALDNWTETQPKLEKLARDLEAGSASNIFDFDPAQCASPLPRAYQWLDGSAYVNHVELARKSRGVEMPPEFWTDPLMYQGGSDSFIGPRDDIAIESEDWGIDFEAELAVVTDDVPMGTKPENAEKHIKLVMMLNDVSLRVLAQSELKKGFGFLHGKPSTAFSPVAVTPDELGDAWKDTKLHLPVLSHLNGEKKGSPNAGVDMVFNFAALVAHAAKSRPLCAGTIVGSGTVSNKGGAEGYSCILEERSVEKIESGASKTPFLKFGDNVRIEVKDDKGASIFGAIEQKVAKYTPPSP